MTSVQVPLHVELWWLLEKYGVSHIYRQHWTHRNTPVFNYSEADFEVFRPAGTTRCTDGGKIWHPLLLAKFHPNRCNG